jgi:hypothetical protein
MSYRDTAEALRAYRDRVAADLELAREAEREASERAARAASLEKELAETDGLLAKMGGGRALPLLDSVRIAAPCKASWDDMAGDDRVRFCGSCRKNVYNLSAMPRDEAEALLVAREGAMCVRLYKRADGTVITADCPVGARRRRRRRVAAAAAVGGSLLAAIATAGGSQPVTTMGTVRMGELAPTTPGRPEMGQVRVGRSQAPEAVTGTVVPPASRVKGSR